MDELLQEYDVSVKIKDKKGNNITKQMLNSLCCMMIDCIAYNKDKGANATAEEYRAYKRSIHNALDERGYFDDLRGDKNEHNDD